MKIRYINHLLIIALVIAGACAESSSISLIPPDQDLPISKQETFTNNLTASAWNVGVNGTVTRDNVDVTDQFGSFVLTFNDDFTYTSSGGGDLWPDGTGTWQFVSTTGGADQIQVGDVVMGSTVSASQLTLIFSIADPEGAIQGRVADLTGEYTITVIH